ncbi:LamG domain-containing protein, partial [Saccharicrinis fermentans]|uniref:3-keto-disaccharide hydrolase domain-containing protein n=1 Tax=Saccharicrinis fermentans DSM 9555 = JCM 21142 TaxID=869213 RepID=W7YLP6_9BACT
MRIVQTLLALIILFACTNCQQAAKQKSDNEGWQVLFNGKNLDGWVVKLNHHELGDSYANTFRVVEGVIQVNYDGYEAFDERFGYLD